MKPTIARGVTSMLVGAIAVATAGGLAVADPAPDAARAAALFAEGDALRSAGKLKEACARFDASYRLEAALGTKLNVANCREVEGALAEAWALFDAIVHDAKASAGQVTYARGRADSLNARLGEVIVVLATPRPADLALVIGGLAAPVAPVEGEVHRRVAAGDVTIAATAPGRQRFTTVAHVAAGAAVRVEVPELAATAPDPGPSVTAEPSGPSVRAGDPAEGGSPGRRRHSWVVAGASIGGVGAAAVAGSLVLGVLARGRYLDATRGGGCERVSGGLSCSSAGADAVAGARREADLATGLALGGAVAIAVGAYCYLRAPRDGGGGVAVTPVLGPGASVVGLAVHGGF